MTDPERLDQLSVDTIRTLSMDAVQAANSGHPGTPMAMAPVAYCLWQRFLRYDPDDPIWPNRDRFVLSVGHASMLLYSLIHLARVKTVNKKYERLGEVSLTLDDLRRFRQLDSRCPGHPEYRLTSGVETTTGPLGQGLAVSVGMAIAGRWLGARFNRPGFEMFDYHVDALAGDGCLMEGVASEAASLAGHLGLGNLCWIWDNNRITIEGSTEWAFTEDVATRFLAYGWNVARVGDANDLGMLARALGTARTTLDRPTLVIVDSHIAYGSPNKENTSSAHGAPLGEEEIRLTKGNYGWPEDSSFLVPDEVPAHFAAHFGERGRKLRAAWFEMYDEYAGEYPEEHAQLDAMLHRRLPAGWDTDLPSFPPDPVGIAGRKASGQVLNAIARRVPWLVGGSADLSPSTNTRLSFDGAGDFTAAEPGGRNLHFGVREHAMAAILNGLSHSKVRPFGSGFLVFSDYARPAIRLSALMEIPVIHIFTHDSISIGQDGPTHQPVEHLASLRAIPGLITLRPADGNEIVEAWRVIMELRHEPVALVLSRQKVPTLDRTRLAAASGLARGGYILAEAAGGAPELLLIASGSEVAPCVDAWERLAGEGIRARVVSLPSWELFGQQDHAYREEVIPPELTARVCFEQSSTFGWSHYAGPGGKAIGLKTFGTSAPLEQIQMRFGFTVEAVVEAAREQVGRHRR